MTTRTLYTDVVLVYASLVLQHTYGWNRWAPRKAYRSLTERDLTTSIGVEEVIEIFREANLELVPDSLREVELQIATFQVAPSQIAKQVEIYGYARLACLDLNTGEIAIQ